MGKTHAVKLTVGKVVYHFDGLDRATACAFYAALSAAMIMEEEDVGVLELTAPCPPIGRVRLPSVRFP